MRAHIAVAQRGVRVIRIYAFLDRATLDIPELIEHLNELHKYGIEVRLIFHSDPKFRQAKAIDMDFLIFGNRKVSIGKIDPRSEVVSGARVTTNQIIIEQYISNN